MRPIWMKIKGLNSFLETQEIDFKRLTSQGLFGIFGPTGSGKSSILDGITLALYGTTARNSGNFIHVATDRASVEYIFSVQEKEVKTYRVSRSRNPKRRSPNFQPSGRRREHSGRPGRRGERKMPGNHRPFERGFFPYGCPAPGKIFRISPVGGHGAE